MAHESLLTRITRVIGQIGSILNRADADTLDRSQQKIVGTIKRTLADARLDIRDFEMADSRQEMIKFGKEASMRLEQARASILLASEHNLFTPVEIAEISTHFDFALAELKK